MNLELKDYLYSINQSKQNLMDKYPDQIHTKYIPYIVNKNLSAFADSILHANLINLNSHIDKKLQYDYFINTLRPRKRFSPWLKKQKFEYLESIKSYYNYSDEKARQVLNVLTLEQLEHIKKILDKGGKR